MTPSYQQYLERTVLSASRSDGGFYFNGSTLKELVVTVIVHHGNEVWNGLDPVFCIFFHISQQSLRGDGDNPGSVQGALAAVPIMLALLMGLKNFCYMHLCFTA